MGYESFYESINNKKRLKELETENTELREKVKVLETELKVRRMIDELG